MNINKILKFHGYKNIAEFEKDFPTEESYIAKFGTTPDKYCSGGKMKYKSGGLSRSEDYGSKNKPYPNVKKSDFAGKGRSYPIPTKADAIDALRLAGLHNRPDVVAKVYAKYPELKEQSGGYMPNSYIEETPEEVNNYLMQYAMGGYMNNFMYQAGGPKNDLGQTIPGIGFIGTEENPVMLPEIEIKNTPLMKIVDYRTKRATTGKKLLPEHSKSGGYEFEKNLKPVLQYALTKGLGEEDLYNLSAMAMAETEWGKKDDNIGHVLNGDGGDYAEMFVNAYINNMEYADKLGIKDPIKRLQVYNGLGTVTPSTEKDYHGYEMQKIYGVDIPKKGINMKKTPLYGIEVTDLRDNVLKKNPNFIKNIKDTISSYQLNADDYEVDPNSIVPISKIREILKEDSRVSGGKMPKEILKARLEAHMSPQETQNYLNNYAMGGYMGKPKYSTGLGSIISQKASGLTKLAKKANKKNIGDVLTSDVMEQGIKTFDKFSNKKDSTSLGKGEDILDNLAYTSLDMVLPGVGTAASVVGELGNQIAENADSAFGKGVGNFLSTPIAPLGVAKGISAYNEFNRAKRNEAIKNDAMKSSLGYNPNPYGNYQSGGNLVPLNSSDMKVVGDNPNETDGVDIGDAMLDHNEVYDTDKEFIFSDMKSLKLGNKTPAKLTTTISKISGNSDKRLVDNPQDKISLATKNIIERMKSKIAEGQEYLATIKGYRNPDGSTKQAMKYGGYKPKYQTAGSKVVPSELLNGVDIFQDWLNKNHPGWADGYLGGVVNQGQSGYGNYGSLTEKAWEKYKDEYKPKIATSVGSSLSSTLPPKMPVKIPDTMQGFYEMLGISTQAPNLRSTKDAGGKEEERKSYKYDDPTGLLMSLAPLVSQSIQFPTKNYLQTLTNEPLGYLQQLPENINIQPALNAITDQRRAAMQNLQQAVPSVQASNIANLFAGTTRAQNEIYGNKFNTEAQLRANKLSALSQANLGMQQFRQQAMDKFVTENNQDKAQRANIRNAALSNAMLNAGKFRSEKYSIDTISDMFRYAKRDPNTGEWIIDQEALANAINLYGQNTTTSSKKKKKK